MPEPRSKERVDELLIGACLRLNRARDAYDPEEPDAEIRRTMINALLQQRDALLDERFPLQQKTDD